MPNRDQAPDGLNAPQDLRLDDEARRHEGVLVQEQHRLALPLARQRLEARPVLAGHLLPRLHAADDCRDVVHLEHPLAEQPAVDLLEIVVGLAGALRGREQHAGDALEVLQPMRVERTASASPTASVSSPGSAPSESCVEKRSQGVASCARAH